VIDDKTYAGKVEVKFRAHRRFVQKARSPSRAWDAATHTVAIKAAGNETRGRGGASATMTAQLEPSEKGTSVVMNTDLAVSGMVAQFGRTGIVQEVAQRMAQRFASCVDQGTQSRGTRLIRRDSARRGIIDPLRSSKAARTVQG